MTPIFAAFFAFLAASVRSRTSMQLEILVLRHQLAVCHRSVKRPRFKTADRILWAFVARLWPRWREALVIVHPRTKATVEKYMVRRGGPSSPTWMTFLRTHATELISTDFFVVPTVGFQLFVFLILAHERRRVLHFNVTMNPSAEWTAQQIVETFPWSDAPHYLLRDRDAIYGAHFGRRVRGLGIEEILSAPRSPWQNPYVERLIGTIRRECLDHVIVISEKHLRKILKSYFAYYHGWRTHQALEMDAPNGRAVQSVGEVIEVSEVGGLHHHFEPFSVYGRPAFAPLVRGDRRTY